MPQCLNYIELHDPKMLCCKWPTFITLNQHWANVFNAFRCLWSHLSLHTHTNHNNTAMQRQTTVTAILKSEQLLLFVCTLRSVLLWALQLILAPSGSVVTHLIIPFEVSLSVSSYFITFSDSAIDTRDYALQFVKLYIDRCPYNTKSSGSIGAALVQRLLIVHLHQSIV